MLFFSVFSMVILVLIVTTVIASKAVLKPLNDLVLAAENLQTDDQLVEIPIKSDTEIGLLTESFNEMSRNIVRVRKELRSKVAELENANSELKETQAKLVHSSKMVSLGQLVAGVARVSFNSELAFSRSATLLRSSFRTRTMLRLISLKLSVNKPISVSLLIGISTS
jgi:two-component system NtrC family sensor kinase